VVAGEITTSAYVDFQEVVRSTITRSATTAATVRVRRETCAVLSSIHSQSPDIAMGVDTAGAGGPGHDVRLSRAPSTDEKMPMPLMLAHKLVKGSSTSAATAPSTTPPRRQVAARSSTTATADPRPTRSSSPAAQPARHQRTTNREDITEKIINQVIPRA